MHDGVGRRNGSGQSGHGGGGTEVAGAHREGDFGGEGFRGNERMSQPEHLRAVGVEFFGELPADEAASGDPGASGKR